MLRRIINPRLHRPLFCLALSMRHSCVPHSTYTIPKCVTHHFCQGRLLPIHRTEAFCTGNQNLPPKILQYLQLSRQLLALEREHGVHGPTVSRDTAGITLACPWLADVGQGRWAAEPLAAEATAPPHVKGPQHHKKRVLQDSGTGAVSA